MKTLFRIIIGLILLPAFIFDFCLGLSFLLSDGRSDNHTGDFVGQWAIDQANTIPDFLGLPFIITAFICALPAGIILIGLFLLVIIGTGYCLLCTVFAILRFPFTGEWDWSLPD